MAALDLSVQGRPGTSSGRPGTSQVKPEVTEHGVEVWRPGTAQVSARGPSVVGAEKRPATRGATPLQMPFRARTWSVPSTPESQVAQLGKSSSPFRVKLSPTIRQGAMPHLMARETESQTRMLREAIQQRRRSDAVKSTSSGALHRVKVAVKALMPGGNSLHLYNILMNMPKEDGKEGVVSQAQLAKLLCEDFKGTTHLTEDDVRLAFEQLDTNENGVLSAEELIQIGLYNAIPKAVIDFNKPGAKQRRAMANLALLKSKLEQKFGTSNVGPRAKRMFSLFDADDSGDIDIREFRHVMSMFNANIPEDEVHELFNVFDHDGDGTVDIREFATTLQSAVPVPAR